jgi:hypothetical protein
MMKNKIQHDAVNNQEDEDSSAYPIYFHGEETSNYKKKEKLGRKTRFFSNKESKDIKEIGMKPKSL